MSSLLPDDVEALVSRWPSSVANPPWTLQGNSPSIPRFHEIQTGVDHEHVVRDDSGQAIGLLQVREVNRMAAFGYVSFMLPPPASRASAMLGSFLRESLDLLGLRKLVLLVDEDMLDGVAQLRPALQQVGLLTAHTLGRGGRYLARYVFDYKGPGGPP